MGGSSPSMKFPSGFRMSWIPAFAGMTVIYCLRPDQTRGLIHLFIRKVEIKQQFILRVSGSIGTFHVEWS